MVSASLRRISIDRVNKLKKSFVVFFLIFVFPIFNWSKLQSLLHQLFVVAETFEFLIAK
jgi:hypothetical protein